MITIFLNDKRDAGFYVNKRLDTFKDMLIPDLLGTGLKTTIYTLHKQLLSVLENQRSEYKTALGRVFWSLSCVVAGFFQ